MTTCRCTRVGLAVAVNGCPLHDPQLQRAGVPESPVTPTEVRGRGAERGGPAPSPPGRKKPQCSAAGKPSKPGRYRLRPEAGTVERVEDGEE